MFLLHCLSYFPLSIASHRALKEKNTHFKKPFKVADLFRFSESAQKIVILLLGMAGCGKTHLCLDIVAKLVAGIPPMNSFSWFFTFQSMFMALSALKMRVSFSRHFFSLPTQRQSHKLSAQVEPTASFLSTALIRFLFQCSRGQCCTKL